MKEKIRKIIDNHFQERYGLEYAVANFAKLILEAKREERERIKKRIVKISNINKNLNDFGDGFEGAINDVLKELN